MFRLSGSSINTTASVVPHSVDIFTLPQITPRSARTITAKVSVPIISISEIPTQVPLLSVVLSIRVPAISASAVASASTSAATALRATTVTAFTTAWTLTNAIGEGVRSLTGRTRSCACRPEAVTGTIVPTLPLCLCVDGLALVACLVSCIWRSSA